MRKAPGLDTIFGYCAVSVKFTGVPAVNEALIFTMPLIDGNVYVTLALPDASVSIVGVLKVPPTLPSLNVMCAPDTTLLN